MVSAQIYFFGPDCIYNTNVSLSIWFKDELCFVDCCLQKHDDWDNAWLCCLYEWMCVWVCVCSIRKYFKKGSVKGDYTTLPQGPCYSCTSGGWAVPTLTLWGERLHPRPHLCLHVPAGPSWSTISLEKKRKRTGEENNQKSSANQNNLQVTMPVKH